jgi:hypothetical protein
METPRNINSDAMSESYIFKHWGISVFVSAFLVSIVFFSSGSWELELFLVPLFFGAAFSVPTASLYIIIFFALKRMEINILLAKWILIIVAVLGIYLTQLIVLNEIEMEFFAPYCLTVVISGLALKLGKSNNEN